MEFEKFKRYIDAINSTFEKEEALAKCIEQNLASNSFCIVDICSDVIASLVDLLATYYDCHYEIQEHLDNEISWWLYEDVEKIIYIKKNGKEKKIPVPDIYSFWKYLESSRNKKTEEHKMK